MVGALLHGPEFTPGAGIGDSDVHALYAPLRVDSPRSTAVTMLQVAERGVNPFLMPVAMLSVSRPSAA